MTMYSVKWVKSQVGYNAGKLMEIAAIALTKPEKCSLLLLYNWYEVKRRLRPIDVELVLLSGGLFIVKPLYRSKWPMRPALNSGFLSMKRLGVLLLPLDGMLIHRRVTPAYLLVPICTPEWREAMWEQSVLPRNTTQWPRLGLEPRPLDPESSAITMRSP